MSISVLVESMIDGKVQSNELFTAHDITLELRNQGQKVSHSDVRDAVHDYYNRGGMGIGYTRTSISVPDKNHISFKSAFLYHRHADSFASYKNIRGAAVMPNNAAASVPDPVSDLSINTPDTDNQAIVIPHDLLN